MFLQLNLFALWLLMIQFLFHTDSHKLHVMHVISNNVSAVEMPFLFHYLDAASTQTLYDAHKEKHYNKVVLSTRWVSRSQPTPNSSIPGQESLDCQSG